jgi:N-terminal domain of toast_rack, DUF2154/Domain of unknown function (DUF5668)/Cell wall-active antibiotics response 4TMS YvqF
MAQGDGPRRVFPVFPIVLIAVGVLFLLHNWRPDFDPWRIVGTYWPLILVFIGVAKIWDNAQRRKNPGAAPGFSMGATLGVLAFLAVLMIALTHGRGFSRRHTAYSQSGHYTKVIEPGGAKTAHAVLKMGAGQLNVGAGSNNLMDGEFSYSDSFEEPHIEYSVMGGSTGELEVTQDSHGVHFGPSHNEWDLHFGNNIPLELRIEMGAGQGNLHLRELPLKRLDLHMGAGQVDVDLTGDRKTDMDVDIQGGVGQANIRLPRNVGVIAHASGGIGSIQTHGLKQEDGAYTNAAYGKSPVTIRLKVQGGIGEIDLMEEPER